MKRVLIAGIAGGLVVFVWGFLSWVVLHFSEDYTHQFVDEDAVAAVLAENADGPEPGFYVIPGMVGPDGAMLDEEQWKERAGGMAYAMVMMHPGGFHANPAVMLPRGLLIEILGALLIAWLVAATGPARSYAARAKVGVAMALFAGLAGPMINWNFMLAPTDWTLLLMFDMLVGWTLAGLVIAAFVRPQD